MNRTTRTRRWYSRQLLDRATRPGTTARFAWEVRSAFRLGGALLLAIYLLFAHGCHGEEEDHELGVWLPKENEEHRVAE